MSQPIPEVFEGPRVPVLDHGSIQLVESWGSDEAIIRAARMSTDKGFLGWGPMEGACHSEHGPREDVDCALGTRGCLQDHRGDEKLLGYLWRNKHSTPFEVAGLTFEVMAPIFVLREWHRHRVPFGYSELSSRYAPLPDAHFVPTVERCMAGGGHLTKQARAADGAIELTAEHAEYWLAELQQLNEMSERVYQSGLTRGIPKELARCAVTVSRYTRMRATGNLRGWLSFLALRNAPTAQYEIRVYAAQIAQQIAVTFPRTAIVTAYGGQ